MLLKKVIGFVLISTLLLTGCNHYQWGSATRLPFKTLHVGSIKNKSFAPQAQASLSNQLSNVFITEGAIRIDMEDHADVSLSVIIDKYNRGITATNESDTTLARVISVSLGAKCTLVDNRTGKIYFRDVSFSATATVYDNAGFQQAEHQVMPILTRDLAKKIHQYVINMW